MCLACKSAAEKLWQGSTSLHRRFIHRVYNSDLLLHLLLAMACLGPLSTCRFPVSTKDTSMPSITVTSGLNLPVKSMTEDGRRKTQQTVFTTHHPLYHPTCTCSPHSPPATFHLPLSHSLHLVQLKAARFAVCTYTVENSASSRSPDRAFTLDIRTVNEN